MCNCIEEITKKASKKVVADIEKDWTVSEWLNEGCFSNIGYSPTTLNSKIGMPFIVEYRKQKKNGEPERRVTTKNVIIYPTFCPFCGEKFES